MQTPLDADLPPDADPPWRQTPQMQTPQRQTTWRQTPYMQNPLEADPPGHVTCDACWEANPPSPLWTEWQMLVKILPCPKTSFAGCNNLTFHLYSHNLKLYWLDLRDYRCCKYTKNLLNSLLTTNHLYFILGIATCIFHWFVNSLCCDMCVRGSWFDSHYLVLGTYLIFWNWQAVKRKMTLFTNTHSPTSSEWDLGHLQLLILICLKKGTNVL